jgi:glycosyltransferase involved in cell wall biosynthesis
MTVDRVSTIDDYLKAPAHPLRQAGGRRSAVKRQSDPQRPLVTVITIVRNGKETLPKTIMSVLSQSYPNIEYVVVDGASTDGTLDVIKQFDDKIDLWISEPDSGTSDAFNKAISMAQGDFMFGLSSDDWIDPDYVETAVQTLLRSDADFVFGNMAMYKNGDLVGVYTSDKDYVKSLMSGNPRFNFPTRVIKRECFQKLGLLDTTYRIINDYEWTLRLHLHGGKGSYNSSLLIHRRVGGFGESHPVRSVLEHLRLSRQHGLPMTKAVAAHLYYFVRIGMGHLAKLFLPEIIYTKLKRAVRRVYSVTLD